MSALLPWLIAVIGVLAGALGFSAKSKARKGEEAQRKRAEAILKAKGSYENIQTLDDDRLIDEFDRLHGNKRR